MFCVGAEGHDLALVGRALRPYGRPLRKCSMLVRLIRVYQSDVYSVWGVRALQSASMEHWVGRMRSATSPYDVEKECADSASACEQSRVRRQRCTATRACYPLL